MTRPRPGHADLAGVAKYGREDVRDILERASARETAARVAAGAVARQFLLRAGVRITSHVFSIGAAKLADGTARHVRTGRGAGRRCAASLRRRRPSSGR